MCPNQQIVTFIICTYCIAACWLSISKIQIVLAELNKLLLLAASRILVEHLGAVIQSIELHLIAQSQILNLHLNVIANK